MYLDITDAKVVILWIIIVIFVASIIFYLFSKTNIAEHFAAAEDDQLNAAEDETDTAPKKIFGAISYIDKPDHVYIVDMDGGHDFIFENGKLKSTGETKYLGTFVPIDKLDDIDTICVSPRPGEFMHLAFNNQKKEIYHYSPTDKTVDDVWSYASQFGDKIDNVVVAWQSNVTRPNHDKLFVFDGKNVWRMRINNTFGYSDDKPIKDPRFGFLADMYSAGKENAPRGVAPIWAITPRIDTSANLAVFDNSHYFIYSAIKQTRGKRMAIEIKDKR